MLYAAHWMTDETLWIEKHSADMELKPYKKTHCNHPTTKWIRQCQANYIYACKLGISLCKEYTRRYKKVHKTQARLEWLASNIPKIFSSEPIKAYLATVNIPEGCTPVPLAMPAEYHSEDLLQSYKNYYIFEKGHVKDKTETFRF